MFTISAVEAVAATDVTAGMTIREGKVGYIARLGETIRLYVFGHDYVTVNATDDVLTYL